MLCVNVLTFLIITLKVQYTLAREAVNTGSVYRA